MENDIIRLYPEEITKAQKRFETAVGIKDGYIKKAHKEAIFTAKKIVYDKTYAEGIYKLVSIKDIADESVLLENGTSFKGKFISNVLENSVGVSMQTVVLRNFEELSEIQNNILLLYYIDAWASAIVAEAGLKIAEMIKSELLPYDRFTTSFWSPGQHGFPLENQKTIFKNIDTSKIGLSLSLNNIMSPSKAASGIMGIRGTKDERDLVPCRFCKNIEGCANENAVRYRQIRESI